MERNPYAPPQAPVADSPTIHPVRPPKQVVWAVGLMWAVPAVGLLGSPWNPRSLTPPPNASPGFFLAGAVTAVAVLVALFAAFSIGLWRGRNWVRITYISIGAIGGLISVPKTWIAVKAVPILGAIEVLQDLITVISFVLLLTTPASAWFKRR